jgi:nucleoid-associated protein YgaU
MDRYKIGTYLKALRRFETYVWLGLIVVLTFMVTSFGWWLLFGRATSLPTATIGGIFDSGTPSPQPTVTPVPTQQISETYTVKKGDSLWKIAQVWFGNGSEYHYIISKNNLTSDQLEVGQVLTKPTREDIKKDHENSVEVKEDQGQPQTYTVKSGDSLWKIATEHTGSGYNWVQMYNMPENRKVIGRNPNLIYPGQNLVLPRRQ